MNLAVKFKLLKDTQPHYIYKPESCLENDNYNVPNSHNITQTYNTKINKYLELSVAMRNPAMSNCSEDQRFHNPKY
jgi:hypothetical protein